MSIYDGKGRLVVDLEEGVRSAGTHTASWDGRNNSGEPVASGTYFYRLTVGKETLTKKLILLK